MSTSRAISRNRVSQRSLLARAALASGVAFTLLCLGLYGAAFLILTRRAAVQGQPVLGILPAPAGPMLVASRPVVEGNDGGPIRGAVLIGRFLDGGEVARLSETTRLRLAFNREGSARPAWAKARKGISGAAPVFIREGGVGTVEGYAAVPSLAGERLLARVTRNKDVSEHGRAALGYLAVSLAALAGLCGAAAWFGHRRVSGAVRGEVRRLGNCNTRVAGARSARQIEAMDEAAARMGELHEAITEAGAAGREMRTVVTSIGAIAFQTNLLALNAAVEAARAGAAEQSFAAEMEQVSRSDGGAAGSARENGEQRIDPAGWNFEGENS